MRGGLNTKMLLLFGTGGLMDWREGRGPDLTLKVRGQGLTH